MNGTTPTFSEPSENPTAFLGDRMAGCSGGLAPAAEAIWEPDGQQLVMLEGPDYQNLICAAVSKGQFDSIAANSAFNGLLARHSLLRSHYVRAPDGRLLAVTTHPTTADVPIIDLRALQAPEIRQAVLTIRDSLARLPRDCYRGPFVGCNAIRLSDELTLFLVAVHHSFADAISLNIMRRDLLVLYQSALLAVPPQLEAITVEYRDFIRERAQWLLSAHAVPHLDYWRAVLAGSRSLFRLPYDRREPPDTNYVRPDIAGGIPSAALTRLREIAATERTTLASLFSTLIVIVLARWSGNTDVSAWICHNGRSRKELFSVVGLFMDHWLMRINISSDAHFVEILQKVHQLLVTSTPHLRVTAQRLIPEILCLNVGEMHPAIIVNFMPYAKSSRVAISPESSTTQGSGAGLSKSSPFALIINFYEFSDHIRWHLVHSSHLFEESTIGRFSSTLATVAERVALDSNPLVTDLISENISKAETNSLHRECQDGR
jgi:hypothetical protein